MAQAHSKFKFFSCKPGKDGRVTGSLINSVKKFVAEKGVAVKSIGVEYVESQDKVLLSLGYSDKEKGCPVELTVVKVDVELTVSKIGASGFNLKYLEAAFEKAAAHVKNVICHEFYVKGDDLHVVLLSRA